MSSLCVWAHENPPAKNGSPRSRSTRTGRAHPRPLCPRLPPEPRSRRHAFFYFAVLWQRTVNYIATKRKEQGDITRFCSNCVPICNQSSMNDPFCTSEGSARPQAASENARRHESDKMVSAPDALTHLTFLTFSILGRGRRFGNKSTQGDVT